MTTPKPSLSKTLFLYDYLKNMVTTLPLRTLEVIHFGLLLPQAINIFNPQKETLVENFIHFL